MKVEITLDNGTKCMLYIPRELFNTNTKDYIYETLKRMIEEID